ncbi:capsid protein [Folsomia candida]|uniref:Capsid protein n=1 Tax=Folsomia candida TaxID=158441 RepID=A0A226DSQ7_FOLCA|nr:capsid protein [Folsomia candida]
MQDKNAAPFFEFEINSDVDSISRIDDDAGEIEGVVPALNRSAKLYLRLGRLMKVKYSYWPCSPIRMQITDYGIGIKLGDDFSTKLQLRAERSLQGDGKRMTIGNLIRTHNGKQFVERINFFYPNSIGANSIDFFSPGSNVRVGWIKAGRNVGDGAKIGFDSDPVQSPRFTTCQSSTGGRGVLIRNSVGRTVAAGQATRWKISWGSKTYQEFRILLPARVVSETERNLLFAVLILWGLNIMDLVQEDNRTRSVITAAIGVFLVALVVLVRLYFLPTPTLIF